MLARAAQFKSPSRRASDWHWKVRRDLLFGCCFGMLGFVQLDFATILADHLLVGSPCAALVLPAQIVLPIQADQALF